MALMAAYCAKALVASATGNPMLLHVTQLLIPGMVQYISKMAPLAHEGSIPEPRIAAAGEVWKAFSAFFASKLEPRRVSALPFVLGIF